MHKEKTITILSSMSDVNDSFTIASALPTSVISVNSKLYCYSNDTFSGEY